MTVFDVEKALNYTMMNFMNSTSLEFDVAWPNTHYEPVVGRNYVRVEFMPASSAPVGVGAESKSRETGIYQIAVNISADTGKADVVDIVEELQPFFKQGSAIVHNGTEIRIMRFRPVMSISDTDWFTQFIRVEWRSDIIN